MQEKTIKVGDRIAAIDAPSGALVRDVQGDHALRIGLYGGWVNWNKAGWRTWDYLDLNRWTWGKFFDERSEMVVVIGLDVSKNATADQLRGLAAEYDRTTGEAHAQRDVLRSAVDRSADQLSDLELAERLRALFGLNACEWETEREIIEETMTAAASRLEALNAAKKAGAL